MHSPHLLLRGSHKVILHEGVAWPPETSLSLFEVLRAVSRHNVRLYKQEV